MTVIAGSRPIMQASGWWRARPRRHVAGWRTVMADAILQVPSCIRGLQNAVPCPQPCQRAPDALPPGMAQARQGGADHRPDRKAVSVPATAIRRPCRTALSRVANRSARCVGAVISRRATSA
jgi:hypothetical protein